jgi:hypothetical protein
LENATGRSAAPAHEAQLSNVMISDAAALKQLHFFFSLSCCLVLTQPITNNFCSKENQLECLRKLLI